MLVVREPEQLRALGDDLRARIVVLLRERARSTTELADEARPAEGNGRPPREGAREGRARSSVVRTRKVRALTEQYYGRTARLFLFKSSDDADGEGVRDVAAASLRTAAEEMLPSADDDRTSFAVLRARLTAADAHALRAPAREAAARLPRRRRPRGRAVRPRRSRSSGGHPMRRLRRPTGGLWSHTRLPQALDRPVDQRVRLAGLGARDPVARRGQPARERRSSSRCSACSASCRSSSSRSPPASGSTGCAAARS